MQAQLIDLDNSIAQVESKQLINESTFNSFIKYTDRKETTIKGYIKCLKPFAVWLMQQGITEPTRNDIRAYRDYLTTRNLTAGTQAQYMRVVKSFFKWCDSEGFYKNVAENVNPVSTRADVHKKDALEPQDVRAIENNIDRSTLEGKRLYAMFLLAVVDGLRTIEIHRANVEDVTHIKDKTYLYIQGKGHDEKDTAKALVPQVAQALDEYLEARTDKYDAHSPLFASTSNRNQGGRIASTTISTMLKRAMQDAGYDSKRLTAHSLRHTAATSAFSSDMSLYEVQKLQGHASPVTTEIYIHDAEATSIEDKGRARIYEYLHDEDATSKAAKLSRAHEMLDKLSSDQLDKALELLANISD